MKLIELALQRDRFTLAATLLLLLGGLYLYPSFPAQEEPTIAVNEAAVRVLHPAFDPQRMDELIVRPIERALREMRETKNITSTIRPGFAQIRFQIQDGTPDYDMAWQRLRAKIADVRRDLPDGVIGPLVDDDFGRVAVATLAITAPGYDWRQIREQAFLLRDRLTALAGTERVGIHGLVAERVRIELKPTVVSRLGLSADAITSVLQQQNVILSGGRITVGSIEATLEPRGAFASLTDIDDLRLGLPSGSTVRLGDIASVVRGPVEPVETAAFYNGERAVVLAVSMTAGRDVVAFTEDLRRRLPQLEALLPVGFSVALVTDQGAVTDDLIRGMMENLLLTVAVVLIVTVAALGLRGGAIVGAAVPVTMLAALIGLRLFNIELNIVSTAAFIIALGILVDNANVVVDEIARRSALGEDLGQAAIASASKLAGPLLIATLTTILAFSPPIFTDNQAATYMKVLTTVMTITLVISWVVAITTVPLVARFSLRQGSSETPVPPGRLALLAYRLFDLVIAAPGRTLVALVGLFVASLALSPLIPTGFLPASERPQFQLPIEAAPGTSATELARRAADLSKHLTEPGRYPAIERALAYVGEGGPRFILGLTPPDPAPHRAYLVVNVKRGADVGALVAQLRGVLPERFPDLLAEPKPFSMGSTDAGQVVVRISGGAEQDLRERAERVMAAMRRVPGATDIRHDWEQRLYRVSVILDEAAARRAGVSLQSVAETLAGLTDGYTLSQLREGDQSIPITVRGELAARSLERLLDTPIQVATGRTAILSDVVRVEITNQPSVIQRRNGSPTISVSGRRPGFTAQEFADLLKPALDRLPRDPDRSWEFGGEISENESATMAVFKFLPLCLLLMILLFVWQFNSARKVLIIVSTIPFCISGVLLVLALVQMPFDFMSNLGIFALMGTIVSNGILVIEQIEEEQRAGCGLEDAVRNACRKRVRPIVVTQATTILGLIPLLISGEPLWMSFNMVVMGGLTAGTLASLAWVPALYLLMFRAREKQGAWWLSEWSKVRTRE